MTDKGTQEPTNTLASAGLENSMGEDMTEECWIEASQGVGQWRKWIDSLAMNGLPKVDLPTFEMPQRNCIDSRVGLVWQSESDERAKISELKLSLVVIQTQPWSRNSFVVTNRSRLAPSMFKPNQL